jgi:hypothetical protein
VVSAGCDEHYASQLIEPLEGGARVDAGGGDGATTPSCPSAEVDPSTLKWRPPTGPQEGKCQADDLVAMRQFLASQPSATNEEVLAFLKNRDPVCADCVFADADLPTWSPAPVKAGKVLTFNVGACYAVVTGLQGCGRAIQNGWDCEFEACAACSSASVLDACRTAARATTCKAYRDESVTACAGVPSADGQCGGPFDSMRVQCVTAAPDAGTL